MDSGRRVTVLIPCAGNGERFGGQAKHMIQVVREDVQRAMVQHVIRGLPDHDRVVIGVQPKHYEESCRLPVEVFAVSDSKGQADTLNQMIARLMDPLFEKENNDDGPCLVVNCDAIISTNILRQLIDDVMMISPYCMSCAVQSSDSSSMSYIDRFPNPTRFTEKIKISSYGMSGAWAFRSMWELRNAIRVAVAGGRSHYVKDEIYLSHALNFLPGPNLAWRIEPNNIIDWNTPESLMASGARMVETT